MRCPRCSCPRVQRWGTFSGRQRYRCTGCFRTFSDLTGTPAAYIKKLHLWPAYARGMKEGESLRAAARRLGIHPGTAFRWRHRLLDGLGRRDQGDLGDQGLERETLTGWVEVCLWGAYTESWKGRRSGLGRPARTHAVPWPWRDLADPAAVRVLVACDRQGHVVTGLVRRRVPREADLERILGGRLRMSSSLPAFTPDGQGLAPAGLVAPTHAGQDVAPLGVRAPTHGGRAAPAGPWAASYDQDQGVVLVVSRAPAALDGYRRFLRRIGGTVRSTCGPHRGHPRMRTDRARGYGRRFERWLGRFRGVATRYLPHYLLWHRWLDAAHRRVAREAALR